MKNESDALQPNHRRRGFPMKLIVLMSIEEYSDVLQKLLVKHKIPVFSGANVEGYKMTERDTMETSWFSGKKSGVYSHLYFAFVADKKAEEVMSAIDVYNDSHESINPLRAFQMNVERAV